MKSRLQALAGLLFLLPLSSYGQTQKKPHVLMISVDGMRPDYTTKAEEHGLKMTTLRQFVTGGAYAEGVTGVWPTVTFPSHTTLVTGVPPAEHGIVNNTLFDPLNENPGIWYWWFKAIKVETLWQAAKQKGLVTASVYWPVTVDSPYIDYGLANYGEVQPGEKRKTIAKDTPAGLLAEVRKSMPTPRPTGDSMRAESAAYLIRKYQPSFMTVHLALTDEEQHQHGPFSPEANAAMEAADADIGIMMKAELEIDPEATIIVVSDHGFVATDTKVNLAALFVQKGLITLAKGDSSRSPKIESWIASPWLSGGSIAVVLKNPEDKQAYDRVYKVLKEAQANPALGIREVIQHDELVAKGGNPQASFFVNFKAGFRSGDDYAVGDMGDAALTEPAPHTGVHGYLPDEPQVRSSFFAYGAHVKKGDDLGIINMLQIAPTVAKLLGVSLPAAKSPALDITK